MFPSEGIHLVRRPHARPLAGYSDLCFTGQIRCGPVTVGDAVVYLIRFQEYPGHRWSRADIATKVRLLVSVGLGVPLENVKPESRLVEDLGCC